ncbi:hypothetical protein DNTS_018414, partial [Danionella cerebrum]
FWLFSGVIPREYILIQERKSWTQAQTYCREKHIDLATVQTNADWLNLQGVVNTMSTLAWTGLYNDIDSWRWSYKNENITFDTWNNGEPNNYRGHEECGLFQNRRWNDWGCNDAFPYFCLNENGAKRYVFVSKSLSWKDARSYCKQFYTDLVSIHSQSENDEILNMAPSAQAWIGLFRDTWKWSDGTNVSTSSFTWMTEQPEMTQLQRPCGVSDSGGMIRYQDCSSVLPFLCMQLPLQHSSPDLLTTQSSSIEPGPLKSSRPDPVPFVALAESLCSISIPTLFSAAPRAWASSVLQLSASAKSECPSALQLRTSASLGPSQKSLQLWNSSSELVLRQCSSQSQCLFRVPVQPKAKPLSALLH